MARRRRRKASDDKVVGFFVLAVLALSVIAALASLAVRFWPVTLLVVGAAVAVVVYGRRRRQAAERRAQAEWAEAVEEEKRQWRETPLEPGRFAVTLTSVRSADVPRVLGFLSNLRSLQGTDSEPSLEWDSARVADVEAVIERVEHVAPQAIAHEIDQASAVRLKVALEERGAKAKITEEAVALGATREPIPARVRHEVWRRDGGRCVDCGSRERLEFDHIVPLAKGGSNTARNIELRCESCNRRKAATI